MNQNGVVFETQNSTLAHLYGESKTAAANLNSHLQQNTAFAVLSSYFNPAGAHFLKAGFEQDRKFAFTINVDKLILLAKKDCRP